MFDVWLRKWRAKWAMKDRNTTSFLNVTELTIAHLSDDQDALILSVPDHPLMPSFGLRIGKKVKVQSRGCLGGATILKVEKRSIAIGSALAHQIKLSGDFDDGH